MIETKQVEIGFPNMQSDYHRGIREKGTRYVADLTAFGWQKTQTVEERHGRTHSNYQILARDTEMSNYEQYKELEKQYESAKNSMKHYEKASASLAFLLLLCLLIPGILYITFKTIQKSKISDHNDDCIRRMQSAVKAAKNIQ